MNIHEVESELALRDRPRKNLIMKYFEYTHLPENLQVVSAPICDVAQWYEKNVPDGPEKSAGLRKLLEAKDCLVRAAL